MLSVVITAWNEAKNLPRVIKSVSGLADEIVVVDTGSTDDTAHVARQLGAKVFRHPHTRYVEPVRNFSIAKARGDWLLLLDADEEVPSSLADLIRQVILEDKADYYRIPRKNLIFGRWIHSTHWWPDYVYRLFKKGHVQWSDAIHSVPITSGIGADLPIQEATSLIHHHYESISQFIDRLNRYTDIQADELLTKNYRFSWADLLSKPADEFLTQYFARRGYADGLHGLILSLLQTFSALVLYAKLWQKAGFPSVDVKLEHLKSLATSKRKEAMWWYLQSKIDSSPQVLKPYWQLIRRVAGPQLKKTK